MMEKRVELFMVAGPLILLLIVLELIRQKRLREDYSLLWVATAAGLVTMAYWRAPLWVVAELLGIWYPPTALFVVALGFFLMIMLQFSLVISKLSQQNKHAAQHIALLTQRLYTLEERVTGGSMSDVQPEA